MIETLKRRPVFYGWWIVAATTLISVYASGFLFSFTAIFEPVAGEFNWSHAQISLAASLRGMESGIFAPLVGLVVNRWGPRRMAFCGALVLMAGLFVLSRVNSLATFYFSFIIIAVGTSTLAPTVLLTSVSNWFNRKMAMASAITASGFALGGLLIPVITALITWLGWRDTMLVFAGGAVVFLIPLTLVLRHRPEQYGHLPDGGNAERAAAKSVGETETNRADIISDIPAGPTSWRPFWIIAIAGSCQFFIISALMTHVMPFLSTINVTRTTASFIASAAPVSSIIGRLGFAWLGERIGSRQVAVISYTCFAIGFFIFGLLALTQQLWLVLPFLLVIALGWGGGSLSRITLIRQYYGRTQFGKMFGFAMGFSVFGIVLGAPLAGWIYDTWATYQWAWFALAVISALAAIMFRTMLPAPATKKDTP
ncbi:MFS transporter [Chloroflexota bacterium]